MRLRIGWRTADKPFENRSAKPLSFAPRLFRSSLFLAALFVVLLPSHAAEPQADLIEDSWFVVRLAQNPIGFQHLEIRRLPGPERQIHTVVTVELRMRRGKDAVAVYDRTEFLETPTGQILRFKNLRRLSDQPAYAEGEVQNDKLILRVRSAGFVEEKAQDWNKEVIGPYAQDALFRRQQLTQGARFDFTAFSPEYRRSFKATVTVVGAEELLLHGRKVQSTKVWVVQDILPGVTTTLWLDQKGEVLKSITPIMGLSLETIRATKEEALTERGELAPDLFSDFFVTPNISLARPLEIKEALYRISSPGLGRSDLRMNDCRQHIEKREENAVFLRVKASLPPEEERESDQAALNPDELASFLAPTEYAQAADPAIVATVRQVLGSDFSAREASARERWRAAKRLENWVYHNIRRKSFRVGFASAKEVLENREGDCSEHAILLAALLRAAGIPARGAMGWVYFNGVFGYHMWTEAHVAGWRALDATLCAPFVDATHVKLADFALTSETMAPALARLAQLPPHLKIDILEYVIGQTRVEIGPTSRPDHRISGRLYENLVHKFALSCPLGWSFHVGRNPPFDPAVTLLDPKSGQQVIIEVRTVPPPFTLEQFAEQERHDATMISSARKIVSGRDALSLLVERNGVRMRRVALKQGDTLYIITTEADSPAKEQALEDVLSDLRLPQP